MHIEPNSTVIVCSGVPWDPDYTHAMNWGNMGKETQASIVKTYKKFEFNRLTYQRSNRGYIRVEKCVDELYDCNYLMFQNTNYGNKWFYAFITQVNYINDITTEILYAIDVITTWWFDCEVGTCFIDRAHAINDEAGDNLLPEGLETGDYVITRNLRGFRRLDDLSVTVATTFQYVDPGAIFDKFTSVKQFQGVPTALNFYTYKIPGDIDKLNTMLDAINENGKIDGVVAVYLTASAFADSGEGQSQDIIDETLDVATPTYLGEDTGETYTPRNKKLLTYPYVSLYITDLQGQAKSYPYEYFNEPHGTKVFGIMSNVNPGSNVIIAPKFYKGGGTYVNGNSSDYNMDEKMVLPEYPQVAYINDVYKNWLALNRINLLAHVAGGGAGISTVSTPPLMTWGGPSVNPTGAPQIATGSVDGGFIGGQVMGYVVGHLGDTLNRIRESITAIYSHSLVPDQARGVGDNSIMCGAKLQNFFYGTKSIRAEYARIIDDYFDMFGYSIKRIGVPREYIGKRKTHTYIKTIGAHLSGSVPVDMAQAICAIYDSGVTFWNSQTEIGNYTIDNSPNA